MIVTKQAIVVRELAEIGENDLAIAAAIADSAEEPRSRSLLKLCRRKIA
ncbi:hypothetical protein SDC9_121040 [bioreactor metagenome]|uniref:Uncharacterized protein n=1 Tax=bioreactor metagenome TaxID=1076179 RepID=A0A645CAV5_9ZZZZ